MAAETLQITCPILKSQKRSGYLQFPNFNIFCSFHVFVSYYLRAPLTQTKTLVLLKRKYFENL